MNDSTMAIRGYLARDPEERTTGRGKRYARICVAQTERYRDQSGSFVDGTTSFYEVNCFDALGGNVLASMHKGDAVYVAGTARIEKWTGRDGTPRSGLFVTARIAGHDLNRGQSFFRKVNRAQSLGLEEAAHDLGDDLEPGHGPDGGPEQTSVARLTTAAGADDEARTALHGIGDADGVDEGGEDDGENGAGERDELGDPTRDEFTVTTLSA